MHPSAILLLAASTLAAAAAAVASPAYCAKSPYSAILVLATHPPAQSFCSARYPIATSTVTVTTTVPAAARRAARAPVTPAPLVKNAVACTGNCAAWSSLSKIEGSLVKSACGCIQTTPTQTITVTSTQPPAVDGCGPIPPTYNDPSCRTAVAGATTYEFYGVSARHRPTTNTQFLFNSFIGTVETDCQVIQRCADAAANAGGAGLTLTYVVAGAPSPTDYWTYWATTGGSLSTANSCGIKIAYGYRKVVV